MKYLIHAPALSALRVSEKPEAFGAAFEKLWIWQKAHQLMITIHAFTKQLPSEEKYRIQNQVERSSCSVCDNIAEGFSAYYFNDKIKGFMTARKEAGEVQSQIRTLCAKGYLSKDEACLFVESYEEVIRGINGYVRYIRRKRDQDFGK